MKEGFEFLELMLERGYLDPEQALNASPRKEDLELFQNGGCGFICIEMGAVMANEDLIEYEVDYTGLPLLEEGCITVYGANSRLCVNPETDNLDTVLKFIEMVGTREALDESAVYQCRLSSAKDSRITIMPLQKKMFDLLQQPGQIPNQDFALHFNTWENIRNQAREMCGGASAEEAGAQLDELQHKELEEYLTQN